MHKYAAWPASRQAVAWTAMQPSMRRALANRALTLQYGRLHVASGIGGGRADEFARPTAIRWQASMRAGERGCLLCVAHRGAGPKVGSAPDRHEGDEECEQDGADEGEREVPGREGERDVHLDDRLDQPHEELVEQVAERHPDQPACGGEGEGFGGEDAADVAGAGAD